MRSVLLWLLVLFCGAIVTATPARSDCQPAEFFVADHPDPLFEPQADATIAVNGVTVTGSTPLDGVYWPDAQQRSTVDRSREFHVCGPDQPTLHAAAEALRRQFGQESVLFFDYRPQQAPDAIIITVPNVDIERLGTALAGDLAARNRLHPRSDRHRDRPHPDPGRRQWRSRYRPPACHRGRWRLAGGRHCLRQKRIRELASREPLPPRA